MSNHAAIILFTITVFLAVGAVGVYTTIGQETGAQTTGMSASADTLEVTHVSIHGIEDRQARYVTVEIQGGEGILLEQGYVSITTPQGSVQLPIVGQG